MTSKRSTARPRGREWREFKRMVKRVGVRNVNHVLRLVQQHRFTPEEIAARVMDAHESRERRREKGGTR